MENIEILQLWKKYDEKLEKTLSLNQKIVAELQQQKAKKALMPAKRIKWGAVIMGIIYVALLAYAEYHLWPVGNVFLLGSIGGHILFCVFAIVMYLRQLILMHEIDVSESIVQIQQKLALLQTSTIKVVALCFLQLPIFSTWNITYGLIMEKPLNFWFIQVPIILLFTVVGTWLYFNIHPKNAEKEWFKIMFCGSEWSSMKRSSKLLQEIERFEKEELAN
jgi:hypothetical protein